MHQSTVICGILAASGKRKLITIKTYLDLKPIPVRDYDWEAVEDEYDLGRPIGIGSTEEEAIKDLKAKLEEN